MGNICSNQNSVGVIDTQTAYEPSATRSTQIQNSLKHDRFLDDRLTNWEALIARLRSKNSLEQYALSKKRTEFRNLSELYTFLNGSPAKTETEKAWVVYVWITHNIAYNMNGFLAGNSGENTPDSTLLTGLSVCEGYSSLYDDACKHLGLTCVKIAGYSKGWGYRIGDHIDISDINHAWNAVYLEGKWQLLDATWGAGSSDSSSFHFKFEPYYFCVPPHVFLNNHYAPDYQYHSPQCSLKDFERMDKLKLGFYKLGLNCVSQKNGEISSKNPVFVEFTNPKGIDLIAYLIDLQSGNKTDAIIQKDNEAGKIGVICPLEKLGAKYHLELYAKNSEQTGEKNGEYNEIGSIIVGCEENAVLNKDIPNYRIQFGSITLISHSSTLIVNRESVRNDIEIIFSAKKGCDFKADLLDNPGSVLVQNSVDNKSIEVKVLLPEKKKLYQLDLFNEVFIGSLFLQRTLGDEHATTRYPTTFTGFKQNNCRIYSPISLELKRGELHTFKLYVPGVKEVSLLYKGDKWIRLTAEKNSIWRVDRAFDELGDLNCLVNLGGDSWGGICRYEIV